MMHAGPDPERMVRLFEAERSQYPPDHPAYACWTAEIDALARGPADDHEGGADRHGAWERIRHCIAQRDRYDPNYYRWSYWDGELSRAAAAIGLTAGQAAARLPGA